MGAAAEALSLAASGRSQAVGGVVSVSATDAVATHLLPPILQRLRVQAPRYCRGGDPVNALSDLQRREADIAIRHVQPEQPGLIARLVREARACFYASESWVQAHGRPRSAEDAVNAEFVGSDRAGRYLAYLRHYTANLSEDNFTCYADHTVTHWALVRQGMGIGAMMDEIARETPGIVRVLDDVALGAFPRLAGVAPQVRTSRRIRVVFEALAEGLAKNA